jgi:cytidylate kinase
MPSNPQFATELSSEVAAMLEAPRHGFQGDRAPVAATPLLPASLTVAISREAGSRGGSIARRAGRKLDWQVYNQELLEYIAQESAFRQSLLDNLPSAASRWTEERLATLRRAYDLDQYPSIQDMARIILALGAQGNVVLLGRGANSVLPAESTLSVRITAPREDRVAYMSQWLRLTMDQAAEQVELRDRRRADFLETHFHRQPGDIYQYDLILNSSLLGEELCAELIVQAARAKTAARATAGKSSSAWSPETVDS